MFIKWAKSAQMYVQKLLLLVLLLSDLNGSQHRLIQPLVIKPSGLIQPLPLDTLHWLPMLKAILIFLHPAEFDRKISHVLVELTGAYCIKYLHFNKCKVQIRAYSLSHLHSPSRSRNGPLYVTLNICSYLNRFHE